MRSVQVHITARRERLIPMESRPRGYYTALAEHCEPGDLNFYRFDQTKDRPDPASRFQPHGVHGASQIVDPSFDWGDDEHWRGLPLKQLVFYELHAGARADWLVSDGEAGFGNGA